MCGRDLLWNRSPKKDYAHLPSPLAISNEVMWWMWGRSLQPCTCKKRVGDDGPSGRASVLPDQGCDALWPRPRSRRRPSVPPCRSLAGTLEVAPVFNLFPYLYSFELFGALSFLQSKVYNMKPTSSPKPQADLLQIYELGKIAAFMGRSV